MMLNTRRLPSLPTSKCRKSLFSLALTTEQTTLRLARVTSRTAKLTSCPAKCATMSCSPGRKVTGQ